MDNMTSNESLWGDGNFKQLYPITFMSTRVWVVRPCHKTISNNTIWSDNVAPSPLEPHRWRFGFARAISTWHSCQSFEVKLQARSRTVSDLSRPLDVISFPLQQIPSSQSHNKRTNKHKQCRLLAGAQKQMNKFQDSLDAFFSPFSLDLLPLTSCRK